MICVACGKEVTKGSMKHPYCAKCFKLKFKNDYAAYNKFLESTHSFASLSGELNPLELMISTILAGVIRLAFLPAQWWQKLKQKTATKARGM